ncbi:MAG: hypothetical protein JSW23_05430, partial [Planctomycetota bacterium]
MTSKKSSGLCQRYGVRYYYFWWDEAMRKCLLGLLVLSTAVAGCAEKGKEDSLYQPGIKMIGFSVRYPEG